MFFFSWGFGKKTEKTVFSAFFSVFFPNCQHYTTWGNKLVDLAGSTPILARAGASFTSFWSSAILGNKASLSSDGSSLSHCSITGGECWLLYMSAARTPLVPCNWWGKPRISNSYCSSSILNKLNPCTVVRRRPSVLAAILILESVSLLRQLKPSNIREIYQARQICSQPKPKTKL